MCIAQWLVGKPRKAWLPVVSKQGSMWVGTVNSDQQQLIWLWTFIWQLAWTWDLLRAIANEVLYTSDHRHFPQYMKCTEIYQPWSSRHWNESGHTHEQFSVSCKNIRMILLSRTSPPHTHIDTQHTHTHKQRVHFVPKLYSPKNTSAQPLLPGHQKPTGCLVGCLREDLPSSKSFYPQPKVTHYKE